MIRSGLSFCLTGLLLLALGSCTLFFMNPLKITAWTPAAELVTDLETIEVSVTFSAKPDPVKAELAFNLAADGAVLDGTYSWENLRLSFHPYKPYRRGAVYTLTVEQSAEDTYGNSLAEVFSHTFRTDQDAARPTVVSFTPAHHSVITGLFTPLVFTFSEPVLPATLYNSFSLAPAVSGYYTWSADYTVCTFTPLAAYTWQTDYLVTLAASVTDAAGNSLAEPFTTRFFTGTDNTPPAILTVQNTDQTLLLAADSPDDTLYTVTTGWESDYGIRIECSEPVDSVSFAAMLELEPDWSYTLVWDDPDLPTVATLQPNERFIYNTTFTLTVDAGLKDLSANAATAPVVYRFLVDGPLTAPPQITRVTYRTAPAAGISAALTQYGAINLTAFSGQEGFFDIYLDLAQAAAIDLFSFMDAFMLSETNSCVTFVISRLEQGTYTDPQPDPLPGAGINETVVRVYADITDIPARFGLINLQLSASLADDQGNTLQDDWVLVLVETP